MDHQSLVAQQFGSTAKAYFDSALHAKREDLERLKVILKAYPQGRILDLGCGGGHVSYLAASLVQEVCAYDLSADMLSVVAQEAGHKELNNLTIKQGMAENLPFDDAAFDVVVTRMSAHHWRHVPAALREIRRVLRSEGRFILIDILGAEDPLLDSYFQAIEVLRDPAHVRDYRQSEWKEMLMDVGFDPHVEMLWRIPIEFTSWTKRINTSKAGIMALHYLFSVAPAEVKKYYGIDENGNFRIDAVMLVC